VSINDLLPEEEREEIAFRMKTEKKMKGTKGKRTRAKGQRKSPVSAFVTFSETVGVERALHPDLQVFGVQVHDDFHDHRRICLIKPASSFKSLFIGNMPFTADGREMINMLRFLLPTDFPVSIISWPYFFFFCISF
jgi:hypothetical protein